VPLTGARVSYFNINAKTRKLMDAGLAFKSIRNRAGKLVKKPEDLDFIAGEGINRLCSANFFEGGKYGLEDDIFFTGEESGGGTELALNAKTGQVEAAPWMGRAAWESKFCVTCYL